MLSHAQGCTAPADPHVCSTTSGNHGGTVNGSVHNHDGVMQRELHRLNEVLSGASVDDHEGCAAPADLYGNGATSSNHRRIFDGSAHNHDGIMKRALCLINELV